MTRLPEHRRALYGRTWPTSYTHADFDPISHYKRGLPLTDRVAGVLLAVFIGAALALALAYGG